MRGRGRGRGGSSSRARSGSASVRGRQLRPQQQQVMLNQKVRMASSLTCVLSYMAGHKVTVELRDDTYMVGLLDHVDDQMNMHLTNVLLVPRHRYQPVTLGRLFVAGRLVRYVHLPGDLDVKQAVVQQTRRLHSLLQPQPTEPNNVQPLQQRGTVKKRFNYENRHDKERKRRAELDAKAAERMKGRLQPAKPRVDTSQVPGIMSMPHSSSRSTAPDKSQQQ